MPHIPMEYTVDLGKTINVTPLHTLFAMGDDNAHRFAFSVVQDGKQVDLSGCTVLATYTNFSPHGVTVNLEGKIEDGKAVALLSKACYTMEGRFAIVVRLKNSSGTSAIFYGDGYMSRTTADTVIDGDYIIYDVNTLLEKIAEINEATSSANAAAQSANTAAETANAAASNAQEKADMADNAAQGASGWANATMSATGLPSGSTPTATVTTASDGHKVITLGIPKGDTGATPQISVQVTTGAAGSEASVSVSGTAEAPVIHLTIPRGDTGAIENLTINGKPVESGTITLTPEDLGAATAESVSQLKDDLAAEQTARAEGLAEKLGKTETAADSAKLGGKAPEYYIQPRNLLDNSDFRNPVNQRGATSYRGIWTYSIDRWVTWLDFSNPATVTVDAGGITPHPGMVIQRIESKYIDSSKTYTLAAMTGDGLLVLSGKITSVTQSTTNANNGIYFNYDADSDTYQFTLSGLTSASKFVWAALYEGSYTADTLPPYVPKGYAAELAECQRYYQFYKLASYPVSVWGNSATQAAITIFRPTLMRSPKPTITIGTPEVFIDGSGNAKTLSAFDTLNGDVNSSSLRIRMAATTAWTKGDTGLLIADISLSADL